VVNGKNKRGFYERERRYSGGFTFHDANKIGIKVFDFGRDAFICQITMGDLLFVEPFNDLLWCSHLEFPFC
jgi:hypothetical protein